MASLTSTAITLPSFSGLRSKTTAASATASFPNKPSATPSFTIKASMKDAVAVAVSVTVVSASFASGAAMAAEVLLGASDGSLAFVPNSLTVAPGEKIVFKNNAGFPHNVVFDEDSVPAGVDVGKISMSEEDLLNAPGEEYSVTLSEKGTYKFYCSPHQGAGMVGEITVN